MFLFLIIILVILASIGAPLAFALTVASSLGIYIFTDYPLTIIANRMVMGIDSYPLLAIPLFTLAGLLMNEGGITKRIFDFARSLVGSIPGGIAHTNVVASIIFAGMSGSSVADVAGLGLIEIKAMIENNYDKKFACAVTAASSTVGTIIPPSIPMLLYASLADVSIGRLFLGGIIPGFLMGLSMMVLIYIYALRRNYPKDKPLSMQKIVKIFIKVFPALLTPVIILGGIIFGIFTVTEAAAMAAFYTCILSFIYGEIDYKKIPELFIKTGITTAVVVIILAGASLMSWLFVRGRVGSILIQFVTELTTNPYLILFLLNILLLILGSFMELGAILVLLVPILSPLLTILGIDLVHFGVVMIVNLMIGFITPPFGMSLFVVSEVADIGIEKVIKDTIPFMIPLIIVLLLITYFPSLVLAIPNFIMP